MLRITVEDIFPLVMAVFVCLLWVAAMPGDAAIVLVMLVGTLGTFIQRGDRRLAATGIVAGAYSVAIVFSKQEWILIGLGAIIVWRFARRSSVVFPLCLTMWMAYFPLVLVLLGREGAFVGLDWFAAQLTLLGSALLLGWWQQEYDRDRRQREDNARWQQELFRQALHDEVGNNLSVVHLKMELLALKYPELAEDFGLVQVKTKEALESVSRLAADSRSERGKVPTVTESLRQLEKLGFTVDVGNEDRKRLGGIGDVVLRKVVSELAINIAKYGDRGQLVLVRVESSAEKTRVEMANRIAYCSRVSSKQGLRNLSRMLSGVGGTLEWRHSGDTWIVSAEVPVNTEVVGV